ncbi:hypothetical protein HYY70_07105, partial [Candidatus Woesearchaeota archaeon]|nr:hypothetical protein [Candidatus Woesearchaeota archaeon]
MLFLISLSYAYADEVGCCSNPGAGFLTCSIDRLALRDKECCPTPEANFASYYKSSQNPEGPLNHNDCTSKFFFLNKACSNVDACSIGCCCSELGGEIKAEAQCKGSNVIFHKGQTNCNQLCPIPQCNDGIDNDNNKCADFAGGDTGCASPVDNDESGGICIEQGVGCTNPNHIPKLSDLIITPVKGQKKLLLSWQDECKETAVSYEVLRCKGSDCTSFALVGITNKNSFQDSSGDLLFDTTYTYQIKAHYNLQSAIPTIKKTATLGNIECLDRAFSDKFCIHESFYDLHKTYLLSNFPEIFSTSFIDGIRTKFGDKFNKAFNCDAANKLIPDDTSCSSNQVCIVQNNQPSCVNKVKCYCDEAGLLGPLCTYSQCIDKGYCFFDRSHSTLDACFNCNPSMACYDYKTEAACTNDNCKLGNCKWKPLTNQLGIGACISTDKYNCQWCDKKGSGLLENLRSFNEVFDLCTKEKSDLLSEGNLKCLFKDGKSKNCNEVVCTDYGTNQCSNTQILNDANNIIKNPSSDGCGIGVCQIINNMCVKNADSDNKKDCTNQICEKDYFKPNTTLLPIMRKGIVDSLMIQIFDKISVNSSSILKTSQDYTTFVCNEPCGAEGHPYTASTTSRVIIISNLNAFDGNNGNKLLSLNEGTNVIRYYSQDPAKNLGEVKKIVVEAHSKTDGPKVLSFNVTNGNKILDKIFTNEQKPTITVKFIEPAIVTRATITNKKTGETTSLQGNSQLESTANFQFVNNLPNSEYLFELNAKNKDNIFMEQLFSAIFVVDSIKPSLNITPSDGTVFDKSQVDIKFKFDEDSFLESVKINSEEIKELFTTSDNRVFTTSINPADGNKKLEVTGKDFANNKVILSVLFIVDARPLAINLTNPKFGVAS